MPSPVAQASFIGGELAPSLHGRVDLQRYLQGLARCQNFVIHPHGGAANRPGSERCDFTLYGGGLNVAAPGEDFVFPPVRLYTFARATESEYILEFGAGYVRFFYDGVPVVDPITGAMYTVVTPYTASDLFRLQFAQSIDVLTITSPSQDPLELRHYGPANWILAPLSFVNEGYPSGVDGGGVLVAAAPQRDWQYGVAGVDKDGRESLPAFSAILHTGPDATHPQPVDFIAGTPVHHYTIYKGQNGTYGFVGTVPAGPADIPGATVLRFLDYGYAPTYTDQPRQYDTRFFDNTIKPACCAFFQQRRVFANGIGLPDTLWASETGEYADFALYVPTVPSNPLQITLASGRLDEIRALVPLKSLLAFTAGAEYVINGSDGVLTPANPVAEPESFRGSGWLPPLVVGNVVIFMDASGHIREWVFDQNVNGFPAEDLGLLAAHLFETRSVVDWCLVQAPETVIWLVFDDGTLASLTYNREHSVAAWARHDTAGKVRSICAAREGRFDSIYMVVERAGFGPMGTSYQIVERLRARDATSSPFLDCSAAAAGTYQPSGPGTLSGGTTWTVGEQVIFTVDNPLVPPHSGVDLWSPVNIGQRVEIPTGVDSKIIGTIVDFHETALTIELATDVPATYRNIQIDVWHLTTRIFTVPEMYAGTTVSVMVDGNPHADVVVDGNLKLTLATYGRNVVVGFPYTCELETLPLTFQADPVQSRQKVVSRLGLVVRATRGLSLGEPGADVLPMRQSGMVIVEPWDGAVDPVWVESRWNRAGKVVIRGTPGLPAEILAIAPEVTFGG